MSTETKQSEIQKKIEALEKEAAELKQKEAEEKREAERKEQEAKREKENTERKKNYIINTTPLVKRIEELIRRIDKDSNPKAAFEDTEHRYYWRFSVLDRFVHFEFSTWSARSRYSSRVEEPQLQIEVGDYRDRLRRREGKKGFNDKKLSDLAQHMYRQAKSEIEKAEADKKLKVAQAKFVPKFNVLYNKYKGELDLSEYDSKYNDVTMRVKSSEKETVRMQLNNLSLELAEKILELLPKREKK